VDEVPYSLRLDASGNYYWAALRSRPICRFRKMRSIRLPPKAGLTAYRVINPSAPAINSLVYSSYVTGPGSQIVYGVDFDASGTVYSTGFFDRQHLIQRLSDLYGGSRASPSLYLWV